MALRPVSLLVAGGVAVLLGVSLFAQEAARITIRTTKVLDGVFLLSGGGANVGVSVGEDGVLMVDAKAAVGVEPLKVALAALDPRPPRIVLNTNWHFDHADGNEAMAAMGATVIAHPRSRPHMLVEQRITEMEPAIVVPPYRRGALPVVTLDEPAVIHFNGEEIAVIHVPAAHSDGDLAYYFRKANVLFTGDLFFPAGDFFIHFGGGGTSAGMVRAADRFLSLVNEETRIIPGHGPVCRRADIVAARAFMVAIRDRIQALITKGQSVEVVVKADPLRDLFPTSPAVPPATWARLIYEELARAQKRKF
jgi:glyoxylase-like metal-dependent hydrolase (beta-lactamase superfamily II)